MRTFKTILLIAVVVYCVESRRERLGKINRFARKAAFRDYRALPEQSQPIPANVQHSTLTKSASGAHPEHSGSGNQPIPIAAQFDTQARSAQSTFGQGFQQQQAVAPLPGSQQISFAQQPKPISAFGGQFGNQPSPQNPFAAQAQRQQIQNTLFNQVVQNHPAHSTLIGINREAPVASGYQSNAPAPAPAAAATTTTATGPTYVQGQYTSDLLSRLPDNSTLIRPNLVDGFSCQGRRYGYYADTLNECQVFHVCYPLRDVFKNDPAVNTVEDVTYKFSFICNIYTRFSQDSLTCAWAYEALPCEFAEQLYDKKNMEFFKTTEASVAQAGGAVAGGAYPTGK